MGIKIDAEIGIYIFWIANCPPHQVGYVGVSYIHLAQILCLGSQKTLDFGQK